MAEQTVFVDVSSTCVSSMNTGIQRVARGLCRALSTRFKMVPVMWHRGGGRYAVVQPGSPEDRMLREPFGGGLSGTATPQRDTSILKPFRKLARSFRKLTSALPDQQVFAPGTCWLEPEIFLDGRVAYWEAKRFPGVRRVAVFYDATPLTDAAWVDSSFRGKFTRYMETLACFDCVVAISRESAEELLALWKANNRPATDLRVEGLPCEFASGVRDAVPNETGARVLVVATLEPRKNHKVFFDACELLWREGMKFSVELVGRYAEETGAPILARLKELEKAGRALEWRKHISDAELLDCYRKCSFTAYPSLKEGFGLPILESLWHGRPCVCGSNGALGEAAAGGGCITVDQRDPAALASAMRTLLTDRGTYRRLHEEAMRRTFRTWEDYGEAMAAILRERTRPSG